MGNFLSLIIVSSNYFLAFFPLMPAGKPPRLRRRQLLYGLGVGVSAGVAGCIGDDDDDDDDTDDTDDTDDVDDTDDGDEDPVERQIQPEFITATESEATNLHHYRINDVHSDLRVGTVMDGAYTLTMDDEFYPLWVRDLENLDDQEYVYTLYDNLEFGAGYGQMTSEDWVFHWDAVMRQAAKEDNNWVGHASFADWEAVADVWAEDELTFHIELESPDPLWIQTAAMWGEYIYPKGLVEPYWEAHQDGEDGAGEDLAEDDEVLNFEWTGNLGPYTFDFRDPEDRWVAQRNDEYYRRGRDPDADLWENAPYFEQYTVRTISEVSTRLNELEVENLSGLGGTSPIPPDEVERTADWDHLDQYQVPSPFNFHTAYNMRANGWMPFRNREVRRAFSMLFDKELITEQIYHGSAEPAHTFQASWSEFFVDDEVEQFGVGDTYDPDQARSILEDELDEYEWDGDELVDMDGQQVELTLVHRERHGPEDDTGAYQAAQLEDELGIAVDREVVPTTVFFDEYMDQEDEDGNLQPNAGDRDEYTSNRDWDLMWSLGLNTYPRSPMLVELFFGTHAPFNYNGWVSPDDVSIPDILAEADPNLDSMRESLGEVFGILSREQPINFMIFESDTLGYHNSVQVSEEQEGFGFGYLGTTWWKDSDPFN